MQYYRPVSTSRRGEFGGWFLVLLSGFAYWIMARQGSSLAGFMILFIALFLFVAAGTSLSNWMERRSVLGISPGGISFANGLRRVSLAWNAVQEVHVLPGRWGKSVHVIGSDAHFHFRLGGKVVVMGKERERMGFQEGELILGAIFQNTELKAVERDRPGRFFARTNQ